MPDPRPGSAGRVARTVALTPDGHGLPNVGANGGDDDNKTGVVPTWDELPCAAHEPEDRPAAVRPTRSIRDRRHHRLASGPDEGPAQRHANPMRRVGDTGVAQVKPLNDLNCCRL